MSLVTQAFVVEKFGLRLGTEQLAACLGITKGALYTSISAGTCPVETYLDGGKRYADYRSVAAHIDACYEMARASAKAPVGTGSLRAHSSHRKGTLPRGPR